MKHLKRAVLAFLGSEVREFGEYKGNKITVLLRDVNFTVNDREWQEAMAEILEEKGFEKIRFEHGDAHWVTIFAE
jgi:tRNA(Glu) U13 pseudouridine synthase TruD